MRKAMNTMDKRRHERIKSLNLSYICLDENDNIVKQGMGRTLNLSESGILLETYFPIETEHTVLLTIGLEEELVDIKARPIHIHSKGKTTYEVGLQFIEPGSETVEVLHRFIRTLNTDAGGVESEKK
jgi:hypothetical protein